MKEFVAKTGEPWITQDSLSTYGDMWIFKEALEKAGVSRPPQGGRGDPRNGYARRAGEILSRRPREVRREPAGASMPTSPSCNGRTACRSRSIRRRRRLRSRSGRRTEAHCALYRSLHLPRTGGGATSAALSTSGSSPPRDRAPPADGAGIPDSSRSSGNAPCPS